MAKKEAERRTAAFWFGVCDELVLLLLLVKGSQWNLTLRYHVSTFGKAKTGIAFTGHGDNNIGDVISRK